MSYTVLPVLPVGMANWLQAIKALWYERPQVEYQIIWIARFWTDSRWRRTPAGIDMERNSPYVASEATATWRFTNFVLYCIIVLYTEDSGQPYLLKFNLATEQNNGYVTQ